MPVKLKDFTQKLGRIFVDKKKTKILLIIGIVGMVLIGLSDIGSSSEKSKKTDEITIESYIDELEKKTQKIVSQINGAGKSRIMITADTSKEYDYAVDQNKSEEISNQSELSTDIQTEIVLIDGDDGESALVKKSIEPKIRGVLVLCEGADDIEINEKITQAVKTVLGVPSNKICVLKLK